MATNIPLSYRNRTAQLTYTSTITAIQALNAQFPLPSGVNTWSCAYVLAGLGSLQMQVSCNDPLEVADQMSGSGIAQVWVNKGTASTGGTAQLIDGSGAPTMLRPVITGGSGSDILTITISAAYINA